MSQTITHIDIHEVEGTEIRVVTDVDASVGAVIEAEEAVVRRYIARGLWRHGSVDLFILHDLQVLADQLTGAGGLPPGGSGALDRRPVVNAFDLSDLSSSHVFVNHKVMVEEGYWGDPAALRALLAHEHAHPLSENTTVASSRDLVVHGSRPDSHGEGPSLERLAAALVEKICCYGPREVFANDLVIAAGSADDLFHLDRLVVEAAARGVAGRSSLVDHLEADVSGGKLPSRYAGQALLLADLRSSLDLAMETAPFYRSDRPVQAAALEAPLFERFFPLLESAVEGTYRVVRDLYVGLAPDLGIGDFTAWAVNVSDLLTGVLRERGLEVGMSLIHPEKGEGTDA